MLSFVLRRIGAGLILALLVLTLIFAAVRSIPGDPASLLLSGDGETPDPAAVGASGPRDNWPPVLRHYDSALRSALPPDTEQRPP